MRRVRSPHAVPAIARCNAAMDAGPQHSPCQADAAAARCVTQAVAARISDVADAAPRTAPPRSPQATRRTAATRSAWACAPPPRTVATTMACPRSAARASSTTSTTSSSALRAVTRDAATATALAHSRWSVVPAADASSWSHSQQARRARFRSTVPSRRMAAAAAAQATTRAAAAQAAPSSSSATTSP